MTEKRRQEKGLIKSLSADASLQKQQERKNCRTDRADMGGIQQKADEYTNRLSKGQRNRAGKMEDIINPRRKGKT